MAENGNGSNNTTAVKAEPPGKDNEALKTSPSLKKGDTVCVGCKLPQGIVLRLFQKVNVSEPVMGGGYRDTQRAEEIGRIVLNGWNHVADGDNPIVYSRKGQFGITRRVPKEAFQAWWENNKDNAIVKENIIIAADNEERLRATIKELDGELKYGSVMEPIDTSMHQRNTDGLMVAKDPRFPKGSGGQTLIQTGAREHQ